MNEIPYDYAEFQRRTQRSAQQRRQRRRALSATASVATLFVAAALWLSRSPGQPPAGSAALLPDAAALVSAAPSTAPLTGALTGPQRLLSELPADPAIVRVSSGMAASRLEDRIAALDDELNDAQFGGDTLSSIHSLRSERMQLLDSLVRVRYAERLAAAVR